MADYGLPWAPEDHPERWTPPLIKRLYVGKLTIEVQDLGDKDYQVSTFFKNDDDDESATNIVRAKHLDPYVIGLLDGVATVQQHLDFSTDL